MTRSHSLTLAGKLEEQLSIHFDPQVAYDLATSLHIDSHTDTNPVFLAEIITRAAALAVIYIPAGQRQDFLDKIPLIVPILLPEPHSEAVTEAVQAATQFIRENPLSEYKLYVLPSAKVIEERVLSVGLSRRVAAFVTAWLQSHHGDILTALDYSGHIAKRYSSADKQLNPSELHELRTQMAKVITNVITEDPLFAQSVVRHL